LFLVSQLTKTNSKAKIILKKDWQPIIDSYWGSGESISEKLRIFDLVWKTIDEQFAAFHNLDFDIDEFKNTYRPEIEKGVSRGRFAAIMNHFALGLKEAHTFILDILVNQKTPFVKGTPLMVVDTRWDNGHFGACLTPLSDSTLLVYKVLPEHVLGLEAGDIILGYEGIPWTLLYKELLKIELPLYKFTCIGSNDEATTHYFLQSAGMNWHLFETIDILKTNGDTLHLPTDMLKSQKGSIFGTEQIEIPGVEIPQFIDDEFVSWGIVEGTDIGYIYVNCWLGNTQYQISQKFYEAINTLMNEHTTSGLIIDYRLNHGGYMPIAHQGYSLLFNEDVKCVDYEVRGNPDRRLLMKDHATFSAELFTIPGNESTFYDKPIAVLSGPGAVSNGDWEILRTGLHPNARRFGKTSNGGYSSLQSKSLGNSDWEFNYTYGVGYLVDGYVSLSHYQLKVDEEVWLTKEGVISGKDDVVEAALNWINGNTTHIATNTNEPDEFLLAQNYPNPFNPSTNIEYQIKKSGFINITIYNSIGEKIKTLVSKNHLAGNYSIIWSGNDNSGRKIASGIYFYELRYMNQKQNRKMIYLK